MPASSPCPFCASLTTSCRPGVRIGHHDSEAAAWEAWTRCLTCGACGPVATADTAGEAVERGGRVWIRRPSPEEPGAYRVVLDEIATILGEPLPDETTRLGLARLLEARLAAVRPKPPKPPKPPKLPKLPKPPKPPKARP